MAIAVLFEAFPSEVEGGDALFLCITHLNTLPNKQASFCIIFVGFFLRKCPEIWTVKCL